MDDEVKAIAEQCGALILERSGYTDYGTLDLNLEQYTRKLQHHNIKQCRDAFVVDSVSWTLLNGMLAAFEEGE